MTLKYHVERFTPTGWVREASNMTSMDVANNMKRQIAEKNGLDVDNYSVLIEEDKQ